MVDEAAGGGLQLWRVRCVCARSFPPSHARLSSIASLRDSTEHLYRLATRPYLL